MSKILKSSAIILVALAAVGGATYSFFSDTETSVGNTFTSGAIDLKVDSQQHYNGMVCVLNTSTTQPTDDYYWQKEDPQVPTPAYPVLGSPCSGSWVLTDLGPTNTFFDYADLKPGDNGENTISLHVYNNDAYACAVIDNMQNSEVTMTEPEAEAGDVTPVVGELANEIHFFAWAETDGDNVWETGEPKLFSNTEGPASDVLDGVAYPLYTPTLNAGAVMTGDTTKYIGLYWCYGAVTVNEGAHTLSCDGSAVTNVSQTDRLMADISFYVEQSRNNPNFVCPQPEQGVTGVVRQSDLATSFPDVAADNSKWFFYNDTNDTIMTQNQFSGTGGVNSIVAGPGSFGAAQMTLDTGVNPRYNIATYKYKDVKLNTITSLKYQIYDVDPTNGTPFLNFNVDFNNSDTWQSRLVQVPTGLVANTWTTVDAINGGTTLWTWSRFAKGPDDNILTLGDNNTWPDGNTNEYRTWGAIVAAFPNAETRSTDSWFGVRVGQPGPAADTGYVDWIQFNGETTDFEN